MLYSHYTERHILIATIIWFSNSKSFWPAHLLLLQDNCVELSFLARISSTANPFFITVVKVVMRLELSSVAGLASASIFTVAAKFQNQAQSWIPHEKLHGACVFLDYFFQKISEWARLVVFDISCDFGKKIWFSDDSHTLVNMCTYCLRKTT